MLYELREILVELSYLLADKIRNWRLDKLVNIHLQDFDHGSPCQSNRNTLQKMASF